MAIELKLNPFSSRDYDNQEFIYCFQNPNEELNDEKDAIFGENIESIIKMLEDDSDLGINLLKTDCAEIGNNILEKVLVEIKSEIIEGLERTERLSNPENHVNERKIKTKKARSRKRISKGLMSLWDEVRIKNNDTWFLPYVKECSVRVVEMKNMPTETNDSLSPNVANRLARKRKINKKCLCSCQEEECTTNSQMKIKFTEFNKIGEEKSLKTKKKSKKSKISSLKAEINVDIYNLKFKKIKSVESNDFDSQPPLKLRLKRKTKKSKKNKRKEKIFLEEKEFENSLENSKDMFDTQNELRSDEEEISIVECYPEIPHNTSVPDYDRDNEKLDICLNNRYIFISNNSDEPRKSILKKLNKTKSGQRNKVSFCNNVFIRRFVPDDETDDDIILIS